jgi:hypothetical protein
MLIGTMIFVAENLENGVPLEWDRKRQWLRKVPVVLNTQRFHGVVNVRPETSCVVGDFGSANDKATPRKTSS